MKGEAIERRLIKSAEVYRDESGNEFTMDLLDDVEIVNVPDSFRFIRPGDLTEQQRQIIFSLLGSKVYTTDDNNLQEGSFFAYCSSKGGTRSDAPAEFVVGQIINQQDQLTLSGNLQISLHRIGQDRRDAKVIGFELPEQPSAQKLLNSFNTAYGVALSAEQYEALMNIFRQTPLEETTPHPGTKEYMRKGEEFKQLAENYKRAGLTEIPGAMFKAEGQQEKKEVKEDWALVAVHPYYLEYHDRSGRRDDLTPEQRTELMEKYDLLFQEHKGPLIIVEEQSRTVETLNRLRAKGRTGDIYFVITVDKASSAFPFTTHAEFMDLLKQLGLENLKFVGGHDAGDRLYSSFDPLSGETTESSGCLRGLANRLEKRGFPKVQTMEEYIYS
jgi:hypothetical protein